MTVSTLDQFKSDKYQSAVISYTQFNTHQYIAIHKTDLSNERVHTDHNDWEYCSHKHLLKKLFCGNRHNNKNIAPSSDKRRNQRSSENLESRADPLKLLRSVCTWLGGGGKDSSVKLSCNSLRSMVFSLGTGGGRADIAVVPTVLLALAGAEVVGDANGDPVAEPVSEVDLRIIMSRRLMRRPFLRRFPSSPAGPEDPRLLESSVELLHCRETSSLTASSSASGRWGARSDTRSVSRTGCEVRGAARWLVSATETPPVTTGSPS